MFSSPLHMNMSVKVTGLESTKDRKAVYNTGTGTRERGRWDACVGTWDLSPKSLHNCDRAGLVRASFPAAFWRQGGKGRQNAPESLLAG